MGTAEMNSTEQNGLVRGEGSNSPSSNASSKCSDAGNGNRADHSESSSNKNENSTDSADHATKPETVRTKQQPSKYREKRRKNNEAARRSRGKKRKFEIELEEKVLELKNQNFSVNGCKLQIIHKKLEKIELTHEMCRECGITSIKGTRIKFHRRSICSTE